MSNTKTKVSGYDYLFLVQTFEKRVEFAEKEVQRIKDTYEPYDE